MKSKLAKWLMVASVATLLQGCVAFPPLIQVQHKDTPNNDELKRRLDSIDRRLDRIENIAEKK